MAERRVEKVGASEEITWRCACCGDLQTGLPDLGFDRPGGFDWAVRQGIETELTSDFCIIKHDTQTDYYVRGLMLLKLTFDLNRDLGLGLWTTLSEESFKRYVETFNSDRQGELGDMFGYLAHDLHGYSDTFGLHLTVEPQNDRNRPLLWLTDQASDHPLHRDQFEGMSASRLGEVMAMLAPHSPPPSQAS